MTYKINNLTVVSACLASLLLAGCGGDPQPTIDSRTARLDALSALRQASEAPDAVTRANAIEAMSRTLGADSGAVYKEALGDQYPAVRFAAAMAIGEVQYASAKPLLMQMAMDKGHNAKVEPDKRVYCAVIFALHRLGVQTHTGDLYPLLFDDEKEVRANAAMVMGRLGNPSAMTPLKTRQQHEQDPSVELQLVEALAILGDSRNSNILESYTKMQFLDDRLVAISAMEKIRSPRSEQVLRSLTSDKQPPRVRVAAAGGLARLGFADEDLYELCTQAAQQPEKVFDKAFASERTVSEVEIYSLQRLAAMSLGWFDHYMTVSVLHPLLGSNDGSVRVAAAMSILMQTADYAYTQPPVLPQAAPVAVPVMLPKPVEPLQPAAPVPHTTRPQPVKRPRPGMYWADGKD